MKSRNSCYFYISISLFQIFQLASVAVPLEKAKEPLYEPKQPLPKITNLVYLNIEIESENEENYRGQIVMALFGEIAPKTVENFKCLCTGEKGIGRVSGKPLHYKGSTFHRIIPNYIIQGGDITHNNGTGGESIYGQYFVDEIPNYPHKQIPLQHNRLFFLTMANKNRPNSQSSQFFINTVKTQWLDGSHGDFSVETGRNLVIGIVVQGQEIVKEIEKQGTNSGVPKQKVVIVDSGELKQDENILDTLRFI